MASAYGLYNHATKEFLWLGKRRGWTGEGSTDFDVPAKIVAAFISRNWKGGAVTFEIVPDTVEMPDDRGNDWTEVEPEEVRLG